MEKVSATGRELYSSQIGNFVANYVKTTTSSNVVVNVDVKKDDEVIFNAAADKSGNRYSGGFKRFDAVTADERVAIVSQVMKDINSII